MILATALKRNNSRKAWSPVEAPGAMSRISTLILAVMIALAASGASLAHLPTRPAYAVNQNLVLRVQANDIAARAGKIIAMHLRLNTPVLDPASTFKGLGADDLDMVEITMQLETEFGLVIPDEDVEKVVTVADVTSLLEKLLAAKP